MNTSRLAAVGYLVLANVFWAGNFVAGRALRHDMGPFTVNGVRWLVATALLLGLSRARGEAVPLFREWRPFALLGFFGVFLYSSLTYWGLARVSAGAAGLLSGVIPVAVVLAGLWIAEDKVSPWQWLMVAVSVSGEIILVRATQHGGATSLSGSVALVAAGLCWGIYTAIGRRLRHRYSPLAMVTGAAFWGAIPSVAIGLLATVARPAIVTPGAVGALLYIGAFPSVLSFVLWSGGVNRLGSATAAAYLNLFPVFTVVLAAILLGESVTWTEMAGGLVVVAGAAGSGLVRGPAQPAGVGVQVDALKDD